LILSYDRQEDQRIDSLIESALVGSGGALVLRGERGIGFVAVDDRQWIDDASKEALRVAARRLDSEPIALLISLADDVDRLPATELGELTPHELELALLVGRGATNKEASAALSISPKTVEAHLHRIYLKLGLRSRTELAHRLSRLQFD